MMTAEPARKDALPDDGQMTTGSIFNSDRLEAIRLLKGLNKTDFLRRISMTRQGYSEILAGRIKPNVSTLERIAAKFGVDCSYFFTKRVQHNEKRG